MPELILNQTGTPRLMNPTSTTAEPDLDRYDGVSFDLFGTLVTVERPDDPAAAIAAELDARDVSVPDDWAIAYAEPQIEIPEGRELSLFKHVRAALSSRVDSGVAPPEPDAIERSVLAAFEAEIHTRVGAVRAVEAITEWGPSGVLSNCSVPGLVERTLDRSDVDETTFDAIVTSVGCGWRKPHPRAFETIADELGIRVDRLLHVGDDPYADGGADAAGADSVLVSTLDLDALTAVVDT